MSIVFCEICKCKVKVEHMRQHDKSEEKVERFEKNVDVVDEVEDLLE